MDPARAPSAPNRSMRRRSCGSVTAAVGSGGPTCTTRCAGWRIEVRSTAWACWIWPRPGYGFSLQETAGLAALVSRVAADEQAARARLVAQGIAIRSTVADRPEPDSDRVMPLAVAAGA